MRRVFAVIGFSFLLTSIVCLNVSLWLQITLACAFAVLFILSLIFKPVRNTKIFPMVFICIAVALCNCMVRQVTDVKPAKQLVGKTLNVTATSVDLPVFDDGYVKYTFKTDDNIKFTAFLYEDMGIEPYDKITASVKFYETSGSEHYDYGKGIYLRGKVSDLNVVPIMESTKPAHYYVLKFREYSIATINKHVGGQRAALTNAIVLSDKSGLRREINSAFRDSGMLHATAVSGMHVSILISALFFMLTGLRVNRKITSVLCIVITLLYMAVAGFTFSVARAGIMVIIMLLGQLVDRRHDALNSLGFAAFFLIILNPFVAVNTSFLLSFFATLGMIILYPPLSAAFSKIKVNKVVSAFLTPLIQSISANVFILPIMYIFFGSISIISPISNMLMCVAISGVLNLGLMTVAVSFMPAVADMTGTVTGWLADYCISVSKWLASFKFSVVSIDHIFVGLWIVSVMLIFTVVAILIAKGKTIFKAHTVRVGAYISCIMLVCFVFVNYMVNKDVTTVNLLDSGSSYSAVITRGGSAFIVGTGGESAHLAYRELDDRLQIKNVDIMILPDLKNNYSQKAQNVVKWSKPDKILMDNVSDRYYQIESVAKENSIIPLKDSVITLWNDVVITPYYLPSSVAIKVMIGDTSLLFVDGKASVSLLPDDFANSHITVVSGVPEKAEQIKSEYIVACCDEQTEFISTADGNIQILTRGNGDIKMKRMR